VRRLESALVIPATALAIMLGGCGESGRTRYVQATAAPASSNTGFTNLGTPQSPGSTAPTTTSSGGSQPTTPAAPGELVVRPLGPGPSRVPAQASEVLALAFSLHNTGSQDLQIDGLTLRAAGRLDDALDVSTLRLAEDVDGDGGFDRAIDRVLASAGFTQDDGQATFSPAGLVIAPGARFQSLVTVDLTGSGRANHGLRLIAETGAVQATTLAGGSVRVDLRPFAGPLLKLGGWVEAHEAFAVQGDGLRPTAARDANGNTHVALFQNYNFNSDVWYSFYDGRTYTTPDGVSRSSNTAWNQDLAVAGGLPHIVWEEWETGPGDVGIRYATFDAVNFGWTTSEVVGYSPADTAQDPRLVVDAQGTVHVVWEEWVGAIAPRLLYRRRGAGGWSAIVEIAPTAPQTQPTDPSLALLPTGDVVVAWVHNAPGQNQVRLRQIDGVSGTLGQTLVAAQAAAPVERTELLVDAADLHLLYGENGDVLHTRRVGQGTWSSPASVSRSPLVFSRNPTMTIWNGGLHVAWVEDGTQIAHAARQGGAFGPVELLTPVPAGQTPFRDFPTIVPEGDRLRVLWQDWSPGRQRIYTTWTEASPFEAPRTVTAPGGDPSHPQADLGPLGDLHVVYGLDAGGNAEVFYAREDAPGAGFAVPENVSRSNTPSHKPGVARVGSQSVVVAWEEESAVGFEIRLAQRSATGWGTPAVVSSGTAYSPCLAGGADGRAALVFSQQTAAGDFDLVLRTFDGAAWGAPAAVAADPASNAWNAHLARTPSEVAIVWEQEAGGRNEVFLARVSAAGTSVAPIASSASSQYVPQVAFAGADLHAVWAEDGRVRTAVLRAGQAAFDAPLDLTQGSSWAPTIAAAGDVVTITWEQWQGSDARVQQVHLTAQGWSTPEVLDSSRGASRSTASAGSISGGIHAFWVEPGRLVERARRSR
jgi:hypothetical protein